MKNKREREFKIGINIDELIYNPDLDNEEDVEIILKERKQELKIQKKIAELIK